MLKFACCLIMLLSSQAYAQNKTKTRMLNRLDTLVSSIESTRTNISCEDVKAIFKIYPGHIKDIVTHMDLFDPRTAELRDASLAHLIVLRNQSKNCNPVSLVSELKCMERELKKQKKIIEKADTGFDNNLFHQI